MFDIDLSQEPLLADTKDKKPRIVPLPSIHDRIMPWLRPDDLARKDNLLVKLHPDDYDWLVWFGGLCYNTGLNSILEPLLYDMEKVFSLKRCPNGSKLMPIPFHKAPLYALPDGQIVGDFFCGYLTIGEDKCIFISWLRCSPDDERVAKRLKE